MLSSNELIAKIKDYLINMDQQKLFNYSLINKITN
jgi:hypothetical protein